MQMTSCSPRLQLIYGSVLLPKRLTASGAQFNAKSARLVWAPDKRQKQAPTASILLLIISHTRLVSDKTPKTDPFVAQMNRQSQLTVSWQDNCSQKKKKKQKTHLTPNAAFHRSVFA